MTDYDPKKDIPDNMLTALIVINKAEDKDSATLQALLELQDRRREDAPENQPRFMSAPGDWVLGALLVAATLLGAQLLWG